MLFQERWYQALVWLCAAVCAGCLLMVVSCSGAHAAASAGQGPTVRQVVEFTRIVQPEVEDPGGLRAVISPDGSRAFVVTRKAEVESDKNIFDILLLDVSADRLQAARLEAPQLLLRVEARQDYSYVIPPIRDARWMGNRTIVFLGSLRDAPFQAFRLDVVTRRLTQLTFSSLSMVSFDLSSDLRRVAYVAQIPNPPMEPGARSVVVGNQTFWSVKFGQNDLRMQRYVHQYFVAASGSRLPARALGVAFVSGAFPPRVSISPDGRWVLAPRYEPDRQLVWARQYPIVADATARFGELFSIDPLGYFSRPVNYVTRRMVAYRVSDGREQAILDAPDDAMTNAGQLRPDRLWQGKGESVILAGTHLPIEPGKETRNGSHVVEYWPDSGRWEIVAALGKALSAAYRASGYRDGLVVVDGDRQRSFERVAGAGWRERADADGSVADQGGNGIGSAGWTLGVQQGMNQPPDLVARGPGGQSLQLTRLNPQYAAQSWGVMGSYAWKDGKGREWNGGLMIPSGFVAGPPRALVIQTYHFAKDRFYLDGPAAGFSSGFAGRAFLRDDMLVLSMPWGPSTNPAKGDREGVTVFMEGVQGAIDALVKSGLVDRERVGILGWSATGERVLNLVTFSNTPIRAATLLDGDSNTLFSFTVTYGKDGLQSRKESINEGQPAGESTARWVRNDPAMHTDCIKAALRIETYGPLVLNNWDIHALLRRQYKAAEMVVIPEGAHSLSRPSERMISLQGNVDWYRFWLKDEERTELVLPGETVVALEAQYVRWRQMAELKRADDSKPRCAAPDGSR